MPERATYEDISHTPRSDGHTTTTHTQPPNHNTNHTTPINTTHTNQTPTIPQNPHPPTANINQQIDAGYTVLPLPTLLPTDLRVLSHNINTLPTASQAELGASFDLYHRLNPSIIGLQETNKNWTLYDPTVGRLKQCIERRWTRSKLVTAHCPEPSFKTPAQPGGVAQMILRQLTARVKSHGKDPIGRFAWQEILLDGKRTLIIITAYRVVQRRTNGCGTTMSMMQQWRKLRSNGNAHPNP